MWSSEHILVLRPEPNLWLTVFWGTPTASDLRGMVAVHNLAFADSPPPPFRALADASALEHVDPEAFAVLAEHAQTRRSEFASSIERVALVRPRGMLGALVAGFFDALELALPVQSFSDTAAALDWLRPGDGPGLATTLAQAVAAARAQPAVLGRVRELLTRDFSTAEIAGIARALGLSTRSLQRHLSAAGTSFRDEIIRTRIEVAKRLLSDPSVKIAAIARAVGCRSLQHFAALFRKQTGKTPSEWRRDRDPAAREWL